MKTKQFSAVGFQYANETIIPTKFTCLLTIQGKLKTFSVDNGKLQFTFNLQNVLDQLEDDEEEE